MLVLGGLLGGCAAANGLWRGDLTQVGPGEFRYDVHADYKYAEASPSAERLRLEWLERALMVRLSCWDDFQIEERTVSVSGRNMHDETHQVSYRVRCPNQTVRSHSVESESAEDDSVAPSAN